MITINISTLLQICAIITAVGGALAWIVKGINTAKRPVEELQTQLDDHFSMLARDKKRLDELDNIVESQKATNRLCLECMLVILGHLEQGNHTNQMAETRKKVELFLLEKK